ncbi:hypothetical protein [Devosia sp.]|uniref:O-antigen ligase family protein n=1 Tax=Devosia sp. TaxID=1871048 RepID=UPI0026210C25|nr:hypothetical protein [Devosia sp.]
MSSELRRWPALPVTLLIVGLLIPWVISFGTLAMSVYRLVLLALTFPCLVFWLSGKAGKIRLTDVLLLLFCGWCTIAIAVVHGPESSVEPGGIFFLETFGAYLVARIYIRTADQFLATARLLFVVVAVVLPFALFETVTGQKLILELFRLVLPTIAGTITELRWSLTRVQGPFEHPILFGVFCSTMLALTHLVLGRNASPAQRWAMTATVALTGTLSFSSGPLVALIAQVLLLTWNGLLETVRSRWRILWALATVAYLVVELGSNQSVPQYLTHFAFDPWTAYYRLLIFDYGWASVLANPLFGTGFNDWVHPSWMSSSIDMFWLVPAIRHGLPAAILFVLAFLSATIGVGLKPLQDHRLIAYRTAYLITMGAFFIAGWAVHFWMATYVLFMFLLGSGMWLVDAEAEAVPGSAAVRRSSMGWRQRAPRARRTGRTPATARSALSARRRK